MEKRFQADFRATGRKLAGYAAVFDQETRIADFREVIRPGAFAGSLGANPDILCLWDHDPHRVLARTRNGSLRLSEDARGLRFELDVPSTSIGADVLVMAESGLLGGCSFGFSVPPGGERWTGGLRELRRVNLVEISVVSSFPGYAGTEVAARSQAGGAPPFRLALAHRRLALMEAEI